MPEFGRVLEPEADEDLRQEAIKAAVVFSVVWTLLLYGCLVHAEYYQITDSWLLDLASEGNFFESLQALAYLAGFLACVVALFRRTHGAFALLWAFLSLIILGEETIRGQGIVDFSASAVAQLNIQSEPNLHDLATVIQGGLRSVGNWQCMIKAMLDVHFFFEPAYYSYFLVLPFLRVSEVMRRQLSALGYISPKPKLIILSFFLILCSYLAILCMSDEVFIDAVTEVRETILAGTIGLYLLQSFYTRVSVVRVFGTSEALS